MTPRLMGIETEYALAANGCIEDAAGRLMNLATQRWSICVAPAVPGCSWNRGRGFTWT